MFGRINNYFRETRDELVNKVSWPTWEELRESTWIVLVASLLFALVVWALDSVLGVSLTQFYKLFKET
jgi:preprotein translocase subunit SecE